MDKLTMQITGMTCGNCVKHVEISLRGVAGVTDVEVDLAAGAASVVGDFSKGTAPIIEVLGEEGYPAQIKK